MRFRPLALPALGLLALAGCAAAGVRRFPLRAPLWRDPDATPAPRPPADYFSPLIWDAVDQSAFRPLARALALDVRHEAVNVNAFDEVPASSWYTNRLAAAPLDAATLAAGPCRDAPAVPDGATWTVVGGKPNGWSPGVVARGPDGARYLLKADGVAQSEQPTGADTIGSRIYWGAGYFVPCNRVVYVARGDLVLGPHAHYEDDAGHDRPMTAAQLTNLFARAVQLPDGRFRFGASRYLAGRPLGPFTMQGTRADDPNDVVAHEDRRDVRASRLLAAWLGHFDAREQNTLDTWEPGGFVRHQFIDFADCLGGVWPVDEMSRRMGHGYYLDFEQVAEDWLTLGLLDRPWDRETVDAQGWLFGYYGAAHFDPAAWRAGYPNPAFDRMTERDGAWMARIVARFDDASLAAIVAQARYRRPEWSAYLVRTLVARRDRLLARYLTRVAPLTDVTLAAAADGGGATLCARDRAVEARVYARAAYAAAWHDGGAARATALGVRAGAPAQVCVALPAPASYGAGVADDAPARYRVLELGVTPAGRAAIPPLRVHLYDLGPARGYTLVGLER